MQNMSIEQHIQFASEFINNQNEKLTDQQITDIIDYMKIAPPESVEYIWRMSNINIWMKLAKSWSGMTDVVIEYYKGKA